MKWPVVIVSMFCCQSIILLARTADYCADYQGQSLNLDNLAVTRQDGILLQYQGYNNLEGPVWHDGALYYSNMGSRSDPGTGEMLSNQATIWRWVPGSTPEIWLDDSRAGNNGMAVDHQGRLVVARQMDGSISLIDWHDKSIRPLISSINKKRFNSPNDLSVSKDGTVYFTDPDWNVPNTVPYETLIKTQSVYRLSPNGDISTTRATELVPELADKPNGVVLSLDETTLIVGGIRGLWKFEIQEHGLAKPQLILTSPVDGLGKDCAGNIYVTTTRQGKPGQPDQRVVILNSNYQEVGEIEIPGIQIVTNVAFGGKNRKTLFITSLTAPEDAGKPRLCSGVPCQPAGIFSVELNIPGYPY